MHHEHELNAQPRGDRRERVGAMTAVMRCAVVLGLAATAVAPPVSTDPPALTTTTVVAVAPTAPPQERWAAAQLAGLLATALGGSCAGGKCTECAVVDPRSGHCGVVTPEQAKRHPSTIYVGVYCMAGWYLPAPRYLHARSQLHACSAENFLMSSSFLKEQRCLH